MNEIRFMQPEYYRETSDLPASQLVTAMNGRIHIVSLAALAKVIFGCDGR